MVRAALLGGPPHPALNGTRVHVWQRASQYLARGRFQGRAFGETLGESEGQAAARLRYLLTQLDDGTYVRPSEARLWPRPRGRVSRRTSAHFLKDFRTERRRLRGRKTAAASQPRLLPVLDFAEQPAHRQRWPLALDLDHDFVVALRAFLFQYPTTRNGRPGGRPKLLAPRQVHNVLQCLRTLLAWASQPAARKLPAGWVTPLTNELVGRPPAKDPLRDDPLPLDVRIRLAGAMDLWQLCHLGPSRVLPMRPGEAAGLLVSDVNFQRGWLEFGHRFHDCNFTKEHSAFRLPFPEQLRPLLRACIQGRPEGPLLRSRRAFPDPTPASVASPAALQALYEALLLRQPRDSVQAAHDRKRLFRRLLHGLGGVAEDALNKEFHKLLRTLAIGNGATFYTLRSSVTTAMKCAQLPHLELRYLTSHSTSDILNTYTPLDPAGAMRQYYATIEPLLRALADRAQAHE